MTRRRLPQLLAVVALAVAIGATAPAAAQVVSSDIARTFTATAPSGAVAITVKNAGAYLCLNAACSRAIRDNGGVLEVSAANTTLSGSLSTPTNSFISSGGGLIAAGTNVNGGVRWARQAVALPTCASQYESVIFWATATGGTGSLTQTRLCACVSDGAASPVYSWRNVISGTAGNATTCNP
jgi:hypothetical protein